MTGPAQPSSGERRPRGGGGAAAPERKGRATGRPAATRAVTRAITREARPGRLSRGHISFISFGPFSQGAVRPTATGAAQPAPGNSKRFDESGVDESGVAHAKRRDGLRTSSPKL